MFSPNIGAMFKLSPVISVIVMLVHVPVRSMCQSAVNCCPAFTTVPQYGLRAVIAAQASPTNVTSRTPRAAWTYVRNISLVYLSSC